MIRTLVLKLCLLLAYSGIHAQNFITNWTFDADSEEIRFHALTDGEVSYTWSTTPSGKSGSGSFTQTTAGAVSLANLEVPAGDTLTLSMAPVHLKRFYMGTDSFHDALIDVVQWGAVSWLSMKAAFHECRYLNISALDAPDLSNVTDMSFMFRRAGEFNSPIGHWDVSNVTNMGSLFAFAGSFNQDISEWNVGNVTNMGGLFLHASSFDQDISDWDVGNVKDMGAMFSSAQSFDQPIGSWDVHNVKDMKRMFSSTQSFDQDIGRWDVSNVTSMKSMFSSAEYFNQHLGQWRLHARVNLDGLLDDSGMDCENYSSTLLGWYSGNPNVTGRELGAYGLQYGKYVKTIRDLLEDERGWAITGDKQGNALCGGTFITQWTFDRDINTVTFYALTDGAVDYTWLTTRTRNGGVGSFKQPIAGAVSIANLDVPEGDTLTLIMRPHNLKRFYMSYGANRDELVDVTQWGWVPWSSMEAAFDKCRHLDISALDAPDLSNVTNMNFMFRSASSFNSPINHWDVSNVTDMVALFASAGSFNQEISRWDVSHVTDMQRMFSRATDFNQDIGAWEVGQVTNMRLMFHSTDSFDQDIGNWNVSKVTNMRSMFYLADAFNQDISRWDVSNVTDMRAAFLLARSFNQDLGNWKLHAEVLLDGLLDDSGLDCKNYSSTLMGWYENNPEVVGQQRELGADGLQYGINAEAARKALVDERGWTIKGDNPTGVVCSGPDTDSFITKWVVDHDLNEVTFHALTNGAVSYAWSTTQSGKSGHGSFTQATAGPVSLTDLEVPANDTLVLRMRPENLKRFFMMNLDDFSFNDELVDVAQWGAVRWSSMVSAFDGCRYLNSSAKDTPDLSNVTDMRFMFRDATRFNSPIGHWDVSNVTDMHFMFSYAQSFNQDIGRWEVGNVKNMGSMFMFAKSFNQDINGWDVSNVTNMRFMFRGATKFNSPIGHWDVSNVTDMGSLFVFAKSFNQDIGRWEVGSVKDMGAMFMDAKSFNQDISGWDVSNVTNMEGMFASAKSFSQDIGTWDVSNVTNMRLMFYAAESFNQHLGDWRLNKEVDLDGLLNYSGLDCENYSSTLMLWYENNPSVKGRELGADGLKYGTNAEALRTALINEKGWTIEGDRSSGENCGESSSEDESTSDDEDETTEEEPLGFSAPSEINSYPIPTRDYLTIETSAPQNIKVMSLDGRIVMETEIQPGANTIDLSACPAGSYLIKTESGQEQRVIKK